jgi:hypothetical protein
MDTSNPPQADVDMKVLAVIQLLAVTVAVLVSMVPYYWQLQLLAVIHT